MEALFVGVLLIALFFSVRNNHYHEKIVKMQDRIIKTKSSTISIQKRTIDTLERTIVLIESQLANKDSN